MTVPFQVGDFFSLKAVCRDTEQVAINRFWYRVQTVGGSPLTDQDVATYADTFVGPDYKAFLNNNAEYRGVLVQVVRGADTFIAAVGNANAGFGTAGPTSLPRQTAGITSWYTALGGRRYRGRTYWPFPAAQDDTGDGAPSVGYATRIDTAAGHFAVFNAYGVGGRFASFQLVILHRKVLPTQWDAIQTRFTRTVWATQRKRGAYGKANRSPV
jgi:hypothetical protein